MYLSRLEVSNVRSLTSFQFALPESEYAGWHVLLGGNGSGKSSVVRSFAALMTGPANSAALNQVWRDWQRQSGDPAQISAQTIPVQGDDVFSGKGRSAKSFQVTVSLSPREGSEQQLDLTSKKGLAERSIWANTESRGWFCASFGPFRRFTGGDMSWDRLFFASPRAAGHLSAFNEGVALTEGLRWLTSLYTAGLDDQNKNRLLQAVMKFINESHLMPNGGKIEKVDTRQVLFRDTNGATIPTELLSDGYRSILSLMFELMRQLGVAYGQDRLVAELEGNDASLSFSGVVAIDEVDAHLHPDWQAVVGPWFTRVFPRMQFIVTTHSPIVCRQARSIWWLPPLGSGEPPRRLIGQDYERLTMGSILDAYGTELFGIGVTRSRESEVKLRRLSVLNRKALRSTLTKEENQELEVLRSSFPSTSSLFD